MAAMLRAGCSPLRDVVFSGVVQEEIGGAGAEYWVRHLDYPVALVVLGEPSSNNYRAWPPRVVADVGHLSRPFCSRQRAGNRR